MLYVTTRYIKYHLHVKMHASLYFVDSHECLSCFLFHTLTFMYDLVIVMYVCCVLSFIHITFMSLHSYIVNAPLLIIQIQLCLIYLGRLTPRTIVSLGYSSSVNDNILKQALKSIYVFFFWIVKSSDYVTLILQNQKKVEITTNKTKEQAPIQIFCHLLKELKGVDNNKLTT